jgi:hypothetical protein
MLAKNLINEEIYNGRIKNLEIKRTEAKLALAKSSSEKVKAAAEDVGKFQIEWENKVLDVTIDANKKKEDSTVDTSEKIKQNTIKMSEELLVAINLAGELLVNVINQAFDLQQTTNANEFAAFQQTQTDKQELLDRQLGAQLISQQEYDREVLKLELETRIKEKKFRREQFIADRNAKLITAGINTALAVVNALATAPFPMSVIQAAFAAATGAVQIGFIARQPVPTFGKGGTLPGDTYHSDSSGGLYVYDPRSKQVVATVESDEEVTNRRSSKKYRSLLKAVNADDPQAISNWFNSQPQFSMAKYQEAIGQSRSTTGDILFDTSSISNAVHQNTKDRARATRYMVDGIVNGITTAQFAKGRRL